MTDNHPITPPPELVEQWLNQVPKSLRGASHECWFATQAARWGGDQELDACCEWLEGRNALILPSHLRAARRPKPLSLKLRIAEAIAKGNKHDALALLDEALPND